MAGDFCADVRRFLPDYGGREIKSIGDALMLHGADAGAAIELGLRTVEEVGARHGFPAIRVGMHTGSAIERGGDWFGAAVNLAARVSGAAAGGEVLLTGATREAAGPVEGVRLHERGRHELKNVAEPVLLFSAVRQGGEMENELPVDPVCRMAVDPGRSAGRLIHEGSEYHFCSLDCAQKFATAPERFLSRP